MKPRGLHGVCVTGLLLAALALGCRGGGSDAFVVEIDEGGVRLAELQSAVQARVAEEGEPQRARILDEELDRLVNEELAGQRAEALGIEMYDEELDGWLERLHGPDYRTRDEAYRNQVRAQLVRDRAAILDLAERVQVPDGAVVAHFEEHRDEYRTPARIQIRQIVVQDPPRAQALIDELGGGADFATLARQHSLAPEAEKGGLLPPFARGELPDVFDQAFALEIDEVSDTLESPYGYHVFQLVTRYPPQEPELQDVRARISFDLQSARLADLRRSWLRDLRKRARIRVDERMLARLR